MPWKDGCRIPLPFDHFFFCFLPPVAAGAYALYQPRSSMFSIRTNHTIFTVCDGCKRSSSTLKSCRPISRKVRALAVAGIWLAVRDLLPEASPRQSTMSCLPFLVPRTKIYASHRIIRQHCETSCSGHTRERRLDGLIEGFSTTPV